MIEVKYFSYIIFRSWKLNFIKFTQIFKNMNNSKLNLEEKMTKTGLKSNILL